MTAITGPTAGPSIHLDADAETEAPAVVRQATTAVAPGDIPAPAARDRRGAWLAFGFVALLLGSEAALSLPDENASATSVATFYADHLLVVVTLQLVGLVAAGLLAGYAWRLRPLGRGVAVSGLLAAIAGCLPGLATIGLALVADPSSPAAAGRWNGWLPRADDLIFVGFAVFTAALAVAFRRSHPAVAGLAALTGLLCAARLMLELLGHPRGALESLGPVGFVVLVATLGVLSARGRLIPGRP